MSELQSGQSAAELSGAALYDKMAAHYRKYSDGRRAYLEGVDDLVCRGATPSPGSMLDFGAGDGVRGAALSRRLGARRLVQADVSDEMLRACAELGAAHAVWDLKHEANFSSTERFDLIVALWNVLGHVPTYEERVKTLRRLGALLAKDGVIALDLNNRHNLRYGRWRSLVRRVVDAIRPDFTRGDIHYNWQVDGESLPAFGHLFTRREVTDMLRDAGLELRRLVPVDYDTGKPCKSTSMGQFYVEAQSGAVSSAGRQL